MGTSLREFTGIGTTGLGDGHLEERGNTARRRRAGFGCHCAALWIRGRADVEVDVYQPRQDGQARAVLQLTSLGR